jgi:hypothetical protein
MAIFLSNSFLASSISFQFEFWGIDIAWNYYCCFEPSPFVCGSCYLDGTVKLLTSIIISYHGEIGLMTNTTIFCHWILKLLA